MGKESKRNLAKNRTTLLSHIFFGEKFRKSKDSVFLVPFSLTSRTLNIQRPFMYLTL